MEVINVGILGATGYAGRELTRLLAFHPQVKIKAVSSQSYEGQAFSAVFPEMLDICDNILTAPQEMQTIDLDCLFSCLPHGESAKALIPFLEKGIKVIDLSADFRLKAPAEYKKWYGTEHPYPGYLDTAVFGLPEHYRKQIKDAHLVANPGCYATSILMPLLPLLKLADTAVGTIIADSKSGVSGAGRSLKLTSHFVEVNDNFSAYSIGRRHRHLGEIDQELSAAYQRQCHITFSPHLLPVNRGILSTIYLSVNRTAPQCLEIVKKAYAGEPFVRVREPGDLPNLRDVLHTNFCDMTFTGGIDGQPVIAVAALDNLLKGASGQALQNMNLMFGFKETCGLVR
ncbi:MAG: N-acetyl-gamma-glutamyl-phosphate reductase [Chitinivibrionales bacterium]|nr:N-acetyl-gamma-glutamyl-phosphate reductase [Chitinivibrionales bacterium]